MADTKKTQKVKVLKRIPSTMLSPGEPYTGDVAPSKKATHEVDADVAKKLIKRGYAEKA